MDFQQVSFVAAFVEADAALRELDEIKLAVFQLEHIHIRAPVNGTGVEQELVRRNRKERLCHLAHTRLVEIFKVLACQHERGFLFAHALELVADVLDSDGIGQPDIKFVQRRDGVALGQQLV